MGGNTRDGSTPFSHITKPLEISDFRAAIGGAGCAAPNRKIGPIRTRGGEEGLTRREAEQALRKLIDAEQPEYASEDITVAEAGDRLLRNLEAKGLKPTTLGTYDSALRTDWTAPDSQAPGQAHSSIPMRHQA